MLSVHTILRVTALLSVGVVLPVPGFAQSNRLSATVRDVSPVARVYVASRAAAYNDIALPPNLIVSPIYQPIVARLLKDSPTFRRQSARIADARHLTVIVENKQSPQGSGARAWTEFSRLPGGRMVATVQMRPNSSLDELLGHEFEHVIEQLDGNELQIKARLGSTGVRQCA